jgi:hypothetical protein
MIERVLFHSNFALTAAKIHRYTCSIVLPVPYDCKVETEDLAEEPSSSDLYTNLYACNTNHGIPETNATIDSPYESQLSSKSDRAD